LATQRQPAEVLEERFAERRDPFTPDQALIEASRCLYCFDAPCMVACPTSIDVPSFIRRIATDDAVGAAHKILDVNVLGASCARVCATEELCEQACVLHAHEQPIAIGALQRYATDALVAHGEGIPYEAGPDTGKRVAVVGGGPAGLAAAAGLRQCGHSVTIFERQPELGGLATYGIIPLREPTGVIRWEVEQILRLGVEAACNTEVGVHISASQVLKEFDAVFLSVGSGRRVAGIALENADAPGVEDALEFIERIRVLPPAEVPVGEHVSVIGAGNTAMDACTIAARLGAGSVTCVYRRTQAEMTGYPDEYHHCLTEGVSFRWLTQPVSVRTGPDGSVTGLECRLVQLGPPGPDGRPVPELQPETFTLPTDHVLLATGQEREPSLFEQFGLVVDGGRPVVRDLFRTSDSRVFAGGDAVLAGKELAVVDAVAQGRDAALAIDSFLGARKAG